MSNKIRLIPFENKYLESYFDFARRNWGELCYQSKQEYLDWLYKKNPAGSSEQDFLIAINDSGQVIGSIHKMNIPWQLNNETVIVPAIHNLLVEEKYRTGNGLFLITASLKGAENIFIPGVNPPLSDAYKMLRSQELHIKQYRRILRPLAGSYRYLRAKLLNNTGRKILFSSSFSNQQGSINYTFNPDQTILEQAVSSLQNNAVNYQQKLSWNSELLRWRFFDPQGPKHLMIYNDDQQTLDFLIVSIGQRKGLTVARLIESAVTDEQTFKDLYRQLSSLLTQLKVDLLFAYSIENTNEHYYKSVGLSPLENQKTTSFIYHKDKELNFDKLSLSVAAGDYGLESINTNIE